MVRASALPVAPTIVVSRLRVDRARLWAADTRERRLKTARNEAVRLLHESAREHTHTDNSISTYKLSRLARIGCPPVRPHFSNRPAVQRLEPVPRLLDVFSLGGQVHTKSTYTNCRNARVGGAQTSAYGNQHIPTVSPVRPRLQPAVLHEWSLD